MNASTQRVKSLIRIACLTALAKTTALTLSMAAFANRARIVPPTDVYARRQNATAIRTGVRTAVARAFA